MTNSVNVFATVLNARIETAKAKNASQSNIKKLHSLLKMLSSEKMNALLTSAKIEASVFERAIYATEKVIKFAHQAIALDAKNLNENTFAIFKTAINCVNNNVEFTRDIARASISKDIQVSDALKAVVYQRNIIQDINTIQAQSQTSIDALKSLNILSDSTTAKNAYNVNITELTKMLCKNLNIEIKEQEQAQKTRKSKASAK